MDTIQRFIIASLAIHLGVFAAFSWYGSSSVKRQRVPTVNWVVDVVTDIRSGQAGPDNDVTAQETVLPPQDEPQSPPETVVHPALTQDVPSDPVPSTNLADSSVGRSETVAQGGEPAGSATLVGSMISQGFRNLMNAQAIVAQLVNYRKVSGAALNGMVLQAFPMEERMKAGEVRGTVFVTFRDDAVESLEIETEDDRLRSLLLDQIDWSLLPAPRQFLLPISRVACTVRVSNGKIRVGVGPI